MDPATTVWLSIHGQTVLFFKELFYRLPDIFNYRRASIMAVKYVFVTGGVVSGLGKGITAASLGRLLKARGYTVTMQKFDPYINIDPGTMNPVQHGEVFVTDDGAETDLDLGHYERFIDESLTKNSNVTTGKIYWSVLQKERRGDFGGGTVQVIPHITNEIKSKFYRNPAAKDTEIAIIEVGGTVGDIESQPFLESIRQFQHEKGFENVILIHVTLIPYLKASQEMKTKPTQASVKELQGMGIQPNIIVCRSEYPLDTGMKDKISLFCNLPASHVLQNLDVEYLYEAPLAMEKEHLAQVVCECLHLDCPEPDLKDWIDMVENLRHPTQEVTVALVGKYIQLHDAYISVVEALKHGGIYSHTTVNIKWVDSETVTEENAEEIFSDVSGILVPGGFGHRGDRRQDHSDQVRPYSRDPVPRSLPGYAARHRGICQKCTGIQRCTQHGAETGYHPSCHPYHAGPDRCGRYRRNTPPRRVPVCAQRRITCRETVRHKRDQRAPPPPL